MPALQRVEMKSRKGRLTYGVIMTILCVGIPMQVFPYIWILLSMFKANKEVRAIPPTFFPNKWLWENIPQTFAKYHLEQNILNSLLLCVGVILIQVTISTLAAYALSKLKPKGSKWVMTFFLGTMMINSQALAWPTYIMFTNFLGVRMIDNLWSLILSFSAWAWAIFILKSFFDSLPQDLLESARIDGATDYRILFQLVIPLSKPVLATVALWLIVGHWNDYLNPLVLIHSQEHKTLQLFLKELVLNAETSTSNLASVNDATNKGVAALSQQLKNGVLVVSMVPMLVLYPFLQKFFVSGVMLGSVKG